MKTLYWMGSTQEDLTGASATVRRTMGGALRAAQQGGKSADAVPMKGDLREVMEIRESDEAGTYRLMYTTTIGQTIYVLDFFPKKARAGIATPKLDLDRIRARLKKAREYHAATAHRG